MIELMDEDVPMPPPPSPSHPRNNREENEQEPIVPNYKPLPVYDFSKLDTQVTLSRNRSNEHHSIRSAFGHHLPIRDQQQPPQPPIEGCYACEVMRCNKDGMVPEDLKRYQLIWDTESASNDQKAVQVIYDHYETCIKFKCQLKSPITWKPSMIAQHYRRHIPITVQSVIHNAVSTNRQLLEHLEDGELQAVDESTNRILVNKERWLLYDKLVQRTIALLKQQQQQQQQ